MKSILIFHSIKIILNLEPRDAIQSCCQGFQLKINNTVSQDVLFELRGETRKLRVRSESRPGPVNPGPVQL